MKKLTLEQITEIAEQLDCGNCCFVHRKTCKLLFMPDFNSNMYADEEPFAEELEELENNSLDYLEIERPQSRDSFEIMVNFVEQLDDQKLKNRLTEALNKKKPFEGFKFIIDNSGVYRQQWFDFKNAQLKQWVSEKFNQATS